MPFKSLLLFTLLSLLKVQSAFSLSPQEKTPTEDLVQLSGKIVLIGGHDHLELTYKNHPKWHTYWKNPGDAGLPIRALFFQEKKEIKLEELRWPAPKTYLENGGITAYGYEGSYSLFYKIPISNIGKPITIKSYWLVCKHICIPGKKEFTIDYKPFLSPSPETLERFQSLPQMGTEFPEQLDFVLTKNSKQDLKLILYYNVQVQQPLTLHKNRNLLTPFLTPPFDIKREELFKDKKGNLYARIKMDFDGEYSEPPIIFPKNGKFNSPYLFKFLYANPFNNKIEVIQKSFTQFSLENSKSMEDFYALLTPLNHHQRHQSKANTKEGITDSPRSTPPESLGLGQKSLLYYLLLAIIGGLILNIMPCVLPIITMKLFGLIKIQNSSKKEILLHNLFYSLGILFSFMVLGTIVLAFKSSTSGVGWGFQLQSPGFLIIMIVFIFILALNMFGLYEFKTPGGQTLGNVQLKEGIGGDFLSGILATILSTPCSAPFLGTALTFAFTSTALHTYIIFGGVGVGLALPFILTGIFPGLVAFLPRPGEWMNDLKRFLGLTLILTSIWLLDVFNALLENSLSAIKLNSALALIFFAIFHYKRSKYKKLLAFPSLALATYLLISINLVVPLDTNTTTGSSPLLKEKISKGLPWEKWSEEKMLEYKRSRDLVFIDFTAKWCFTCKINEKLVLETQAFKELVSKNKIKLLLADWTKRDEVIGRYLKSHGLVGVPAYFLQKKDGELMALGETISILKINSYLDEEGLQKTEEY